MTGASTPGVLRPEGPFVTVLTARNRGAIAVIRVWGAGAVAVTNSAFRPARGTILDASPANRPRFGRFGDGIGDEVVAVVLGESGGAIEAEIQCHGGPAAVALVLGALLDRGASHRPPEEWMSVNAASPIRAMASIDLAGAETERVARLLLTQSDGTLDEAINAIIALLETNPPEAIPPLENLDRRAEVGLRLLGGWRVVLAGRPNVGKSLLLNAIAGFGRAIVSPTPGTTRDVVTVRTAIDGWPVELSDTAGLRDTADPIEAGGVILARSTQGRADVVLLVLDRSEPLREVDHQLLDSHPDAIIVANKSDLAPAWEPRALVPTAVSLSAETGEGLDDLLGTIASRIVPDPPPAGSAIPFRAEHRRGIARALRFLRGGRPESARRSLHRLRSRGR